MIRKGFLAGAAAWMALAGVAAQAQDVRPKRPADDCITTPEAEALFMTVAPIAVREITQFCEAELPSSAYLRSNDGLVAKYRAGAAEAGPGTLAAARKLAANSALAGATAEDMLKMLDGVIGPMLAKQLKAKDCPTYDRMFALIDPLPARNAAGLVVMLVQLGMDGKKDNDFPLCPLSNAQ